jgi:hypothetical protein
LSESAECSSSLMMVHRLAGSSQQSCSLVL